MAPLFCSPLALDRGLAQLLPLLQVVLHLPRTPLLSLPALMQGWLLVAAGMRSLEAAQVAPLLYSPLALDWGLAQLPPLPRLWMVMVLPLSLVAFGLLASRPVASLQEGLQMLGQLLLLQEASEMVPAPL